MAEIFQFSKYLLNLLSHNAQEKVLSVEKRLELRQGIAFLQNLGRSLGFEATVIGARWFSPIVGFAPKFPFSSVSPGYPSLTPSLRWESWVGFEVRQMNLLIVADSVCH